ncbi:hypothetical protein C464_02858 [Halorubrum coriense DSM 10284]|uniref:Uncharacterized protein n=1 Tax=Halorubrum coriense DSM 10284 TaxID=1227466 RepID=M0ER83_9EURY|nr:hypothetical protein [Halorubrum coriense]ELZ50200.1 hypothetical protein C464_02858 [Halorubrum coriense DSM 10284]
MDWHAVDALDRATDGTRRFLFPFEAVRWAKLAFLALAMAGGGISGFRAGIPSFSASTVGFGVLTTGFGASTIGLSAGAEAVSPSAESVPLSGGFLPEAFGGAAASGLDRLVGLNESLLVALAVVTLLVALALVACSFAFRLAFYDALATGEVALWRSLRARFRQASELLAILAGIAVVAATPVVAVVAAVGSTSIFLTGSTPLPVVGVSPGGSLGFPGPVTAAIVAVGVAVTLIGIVVSRLTFEFVAPAMVARDVGVIAGWRAVWASLRGSWSEVVAYLVVHALVATGVRIVLTLAVASVAAVVAVTGFVVALVAAVPLGGVEAVFGTTAGLFVLGTVLLCSVVALVAVTLPVRLVTRTYLTAYEVSTLAGIDPDLSPLAPSGAASDGTASIGGGRAGTR